jgi:hypothetical protein
MSHTPHPTIQGASHNPLFSGAVDQDWTGDLVLTKDALYQLSYNGFNPSIKHLVDREGFEPSYLARRDRFTVCWL